MYYLVAGTSETHLAPERHRVPRSARVEHAALQELTAGTPLDPDHSRPLPENARVLGVDTSDGVATVDWSPAVLTGGGARAEVLGIQSVVYTLRQFPGVERVAFTVEGQSQGRASNGRTIEDWWGHVGLRDQPFSPEPAAEILAPLVLWTPQDDLESAGRLEVSGELTVSGQSVSALIEDADGRAVVRVEVDADQQPSIDGAAASFRKTIVFTAPETAQRWRILVFTHGTDNEPRFLEDRRFTATTDA